MKSISYKQSRKNSARRWRKAKVRRLTGRASWVEAGFSTLRSRIGA